MTDRPEPRPEQESETPRIDRFIAVTLAYQSNDASSIDVAIAAREALKDTRIAALKASASLANNLCSDHRDKQAGKPCLACRIEQLERELSALTARERDALERAAKVCEERAAKIARNYSEADPMPLYVSGAHNEAICLAITLRALTPSTGGR